MCVHRVFFSRHFGTYVAHVYTWDNERKRVKLNSLKAAPAAVFTDFIVDKLMK